MNSLLFDKNELMDNPACRIPICLVLDTSGSMFGEPMKRLVSSLQHFIEEIRANDVSKAATDIAIITFGKKVEVVTDFQNVKDDIGLNFIAFGETPLGTAMNKAHQLLKNRVSLYKSMGVDYYKPWIVLITDGAPTDDIEQAVSKTVNLLMDKQLTIFPVAVGDYADIQTLKRFSPMRDPLVLDELKFKEFFSWLSESVHRVSVSLPDEEVKLPPVDPWKKL